MGKISVNHCILFFPLKANAAMKMANCLCLFFQFCQLKVWQKVRDRFSHTVKLSSAKMKTILDSIISAAMPQFVPLLEYSFSRNIALVVSRI